MHTNDDHGAVEQIMRLRAQRPLAVDRRATALIVVDVQPNFVDAEQPFMRTLEAMAPGATHGYRSRVTERVLPNLARLIEGCRTDGLPIAYTGTGTCRDDRADLPG